MNHGGEEKSALFILKYKHSPVPALPPLTPVVTIARLDHAVGREPLHVVRPHHTTTTEYAFHWRHHDGGGGIAANGLGCSSASV